MFDTCYSQDISSIALHYTARFETRTTFSKWQIAQDRWCWADRKPGSVTLNSSWSQISKLLSWLSCLQHLAIITQSVHHLMDVECNICWSMPDWCAGLSTSYSGLNKGWFRLSNQRTEHVAIHCIKSHGEQFFSQSEVQSRRSNKSKVLEEFYVRWKGSTFVSLFLHVSWDQLISYE